MKNPIKNLFLSKEVRQALKESNESAMHAMQAREVIESIYVTEKLSEMFGKKPEDIAGALKEDYYTELLVWKMLASKEQQEVEDQKEKKESLIPA